MTALGIILMLLGYAIILFWGSKDRVALGVFGGLLVAAGAVCLV